MHLSTSIWSHRQPLDSSLKQRPENTTSSNSRWKTLQLVERIVIKNALGATALLGGACLIYSGFSMGCECAEDSPSEVCVFKDGCTGEEWASGAMRICAGYVSCLVGTIMLFKEKHPSS